MWRLAAACWPDQPVQIKGMSTAFSFHKDGDVVVGCQRLSQRACELSWDRLAGRRTRRT